MSRFVRSDVASAIDIQTGAVVSRVIFSDNRIEVTVFGFDAGAGLSEHQASAYRGFPHPVHYIYGSLSRNEYVVGMRDRLQALFPDFTSECYEGRHHFDTPNQAEPARLAQELRRHWSRAIALVGLTGPRLVVHRL